MNNNAYDVMGINQSDLNSYKKVAKVLENMVNNNQEVAGTSAKPNCNCPFKNIKNTYLAPYDVDDEDENGVMGYVEDNENMEDEMGLENEMYEDVEAESIFCEKGKHFLTERGECGYDCEFGCGCNSDCKGCSDVSPVGYDDEYDDYMGGCKTCGRPKMGRRYM